MAEVYKRLFVVGQGFAGVLVGIFGKWTNVMSIWVTLVVLDYLSGVFKAVASDDTKLSSRVSGKGLVRKCVHLIVIATFFQVGRFVGGQGLFFRNSVAGLFVVHEVTSILENFVAMQRKTGNLAFANDIVRLAERFLGKDLVKDKEEV